MTDLQAVVLSVVNRFCGTSSGFCTGELAAHIGRQPGHEGNHQHSALIGRELRALERAGLVGRLDNLKPVVWRKVGGA